MLGCVIVTRHSSSYGFSKQLEFAVIQSGGLGCLSRVGCVLTACRIGRPGIVLEHPFLKTGVPVISHTSHSSMPRYTDNWPFIIQSRVCGNSVVGTVVTHPWLNNKRPIVSVPRHGTMRSMRNNRNGSPYNTTPESYCTGWIVNHGMTGCFRELGFGRGLTGQTLLEIDMARFLTSYV